MIRLFLALALATLPAALGGCCSVFCPSPATDPTRLTRDTPDRAVDYLVEAVREGRVADIYESLHPRFREANGDFSLNELSIGYSRLEDAVRADVERFARARRSEVRYHEDGNAYVKLVDEDASVILGFRNQPGWEVHLDDELFPKVEGYMPALSGGVAVEGDRLLLEVDLGGQGGFPSELVTRVTAHRDWLLVAVLEPVNISLADLFEQQYGGQ